MVQHSYMKTQWRINQKTVIYSASVCLLKVSELERIVTSTVWSVLTSNCQCYQDLRNTCSLTGKKVKGSWWFEWVTASRWVAKIKSKKRKMQSRCKGSTMHRWHPVLGCDCLSQSFLSILPNLDTRFHCRARCCVLDTLAKVCKRVPILTLATSIFEVC